MNQRKNEERESVGDGDRSLNGHIRRMCESEREKGMEKERKRAEERKKKMEIREENEPERK